MHGHYLIKQPTNRSPEVAQEPMESKPSTSTSAADEAAARAASKRYEALVMIKSKAMKGKGAWYWAHLEPFLAFSETTGLPKAAKLRCSLCDATFSASNPSRTSNDHLKKGSCPNFVSSDTADPQPSLAKPITSAPPLNRKRPRMAAADPPLLLLPPPPPTAAVVPQQHVVLSGGKEDLEPLARLEDSVKRLKSPKASPAPPLPKPLVDAAVALLAEWVFKSFGAVSPSSLTHPKFTELLRLVGLPPISLRHLLGPALDSLHRAAAADSLSKIRDAAFFQLSSCGWKKQKFAPDEHKFVHITVNLPNGTTVFQRAILTVAARATPSHAELLLTAAIDETSDGIAVRCAGILTDRFGSSALSNLETRHRSMVNLACQLEGISSLVKDFVRELPLFETTIANCFKLAEFFSKHPQARDIFHKCQLRDSGTARLLRVPSSIEDPIAHLGPVFTMLEDVLDSIGALQLLILHEDYKLISTNDRIAGELGELVEDSRFWNELEAVHSIVNVINDTVRQLELERPLVGQCLPIWNELKSKVHDWCNNYNIEVEVLDNLIARRMKKNYHPAWSAAFILDPLYLREDPSGKYLPPFHLLTGEQEKDVDKLITRLVTREEAHIALMELMKWRAEGLDPLYAKAVQVKQADPVTGKLRVANPQSSRLVWETCLSEYKTLGKVAVRIIFLRVTATCGLSSRPPVMQWVGDCDHSRAAVERAEKMVFVAAHAKLERRDFSSESKDVELLNEEAEDALGYAPSV